jgi:hypothetical protein
LNRDLGPLRNTIVVLVEVAVAAVFTQATFAANAVRISQIYGGGGNTGATYSRDYVELFNSSGSPVNIGGWSLQYGSATGTINLGTCPNCLTVIPQGATIPAYGYYLIALAQGTVAAPALPVTPDLDVPQAAANNLSATAGKIGLKTDALAAGTPCSPQSAFVDLIGWGSTANCFETAPTAPPSNSSMAVRNNGGLIDTDNNSTDFAIVSAAVPRNSSSTNTPLVTITASAGANGSISPSGPVSVNYGSDQAFALIPNVGYHVASVAVDGGSVGPVQSYTFTNVITSHTIEANFTIDPPAVGSIELFFDTHLTMRSISISPGQSGTLYVVADLTGLNGITGAEFSISGWPSTMTATPSYPNEPVTLGNPITGGVNIAYPSCRDSVKIVLCKIDYFAFGSVPPATLSVAQHSSPSSPLFPWPQILNCDEPTFTRTRVTPGRATINVENGCTVDVDPPTINVPPAVTLAQPTDTPSCNLFVSDADLGIATASDNCPSPVVITRIGVPESSLFPVGITTVTYTARDGGGNTETATQTVTVIDRTPPAITAPPGVTASTPPVSADCGLILPDDALGSATATDCSRVDLHRTGVPAGNLFPVGTTTVTYTATDADGNTASATQTVTVIDKTRPRITPPAAKSYQHAAEVPPAHPADAIASDNCSAASVTVTESSNGGMGSPISPLVITRTYTATDTAGNDASASQTITVGKLAISAIPSTGANTGVVTVRIFGRGFDNSRPGFDQGTIVKLTRSGQPDIVVRPVVFPNYLCTDLALGGVALGSWDVVVVMSDGATITSPGGFTIADRGAGQVSVDIVGPSVVPASIVHQNTRARYYLVLSSTRSTDSMGRLSLSVAPSINVRFASVWSPDQPFPGFPHDFSDTDGTTGFSHDGDQLFLFNDRLLRAGERSVTILEVSFPIGVPGQTAADLHAEWEDAPSGRSCQ